MNKLPTFLIDIICFWFHGKHRKVITFYSNHSHRYFCKKCNREFDE